MSVPHPVPLLINPGPSERGWHRLELSLQCLQKYAWSYVGGLRSESSPAQMLGSLCHGGIGHFRARQRQDQLGLDRDAYYEPDVAIQLIGEQMGAGVDLIECAQAIVADYIAYWSMRERIKILHIEEVFEIRYPIKGPPIRGLDHVRMTARADLVYEDATGKVYILDTKTTSRIEAKHPKFYGVSGQMLNYKWIGAMAYGDRFGGVVLDLVQTKGERLFERPRLEQAPALFARFPQIVEDAERRIANVEAEGRAVGAWPAVANELSCFSRYGACPHIERCKWGTADGKQAPH